MTAEQIDQRTKMATKLGAALLGNPPWVEKTYDYAKANGVDFPKVFATTVTSFTDELIHRLEFTQKPSPSPRRFQQ